MINIDIQQELQFELIENEKLLWTGRPQTGLVFRTMDIFFIPFSLIWFGGMSFAAFSAATGRVPFPVTLFFIPFVVAGLYITVGRFYFDMRRRANTVYAITDSRVIIRSGIFSKSVNSLNIKTLSGISINERSDGSGSITLGQADPRFMMMQGMTMWGNKQTPMLERIDGVRDVYSLILKIQRV